jgi:hypothetical protein
MNASSRARWRNHEYTQRHMLEQDFYWQATIKEEAGKLQDLLSDEQYDQFVTAMPNQADWLPILQRARAFILAHVGQEIVMDELVAAALNSVPQQDGPA